MHGFSSVHGMPERQAAYAIESSKRGGQKEEKKPMCLRKFCLSKEKKRGTLDMQPWVTNFLITLDIGIDLVGLKEKKSG